MKAFVTISLKKYDEMKDRIRKLENDTAINFNFFPSNKDLKKQIRYLKLKLKELKK